IQMILTSFLLASFCLLASAFDDVVTYGSVVKLMNVQEGVRLHSHEVKYGSGSGQQSVTGVKNSDDVNSHWTLLAPLGKPTIRGEPVLCGEKVRLQHLKTECFLHSHHFDAPLSKGSQEVSCFGSEKESDTGDNWEVLCGSEEWLESESVRLQHVDTGAFLALSGQQFGRPIAGQREVVGLARESGLVSWRVAEGVLMGRNKQE
ncbi:hypothetical protein PENTCL1PPCAC_23735, partial [Pristionchus entomophagus]